MPDPERPYIVTKGVDLLKKVAETNGIKADPEEYLKRSNGNYSDAMDIMLDENGYEPYDEATKKQIHDKEQLPILSSDYILKNRLSDAEQKDLETKSNEIFDEIRRGAGSDALSHNEKEYGTVGKWRVKQSSKSYIDGLKAELNTINERLRRDSDLRDLLPNVIKPEENVLGQKSYKKLKNEANKEIDSFTPAPGLSYRDYSPADQKLLLEDQKKEKAQKNLQEKIELDKEYLSDPVVITANTAAVTAKALGNKEKEGLYASKKILNDQAAKLNRQYDMALEKFRAEPTEENGARVDYIGAHIDAQAKEIAKGDKIANAVSIYARKKAKEVEAKAEVQGTIANIGTYLGNVGLSVRDRIANGLDDIISGKDDTLEEHQAKNLERGIAEADRMQQSRLRGGFRERYVEVDGQKLVVDNDGEVLYGVDDKFRPTDKDISKFVAKYEVNPDAYEQKADYSPTRLIGTSIQVMADMVPIIAANAAIGVASAALPGGQAKTLQALGSIGASAVTMFSDNLKRNLELGKGYNYAWNTAMGTTLVQALIEQAGGLEARAGRALGETAKTAMRTKLDDLVQSYAGRSLAKTDLVKKAKGVIKEYIGEDFEESGQDITAQVSDHMFYGVDINIDWNDQFNTWASLPLGVGGVKAIVGHLQNKADRDMMRRGYNAAQSSTSGFNEVLDSQVADKSITEKEASIKKEVLSESKADYDAINDNYDHIPEKGKNRLVSLMADRDMNRMMAKYIEIGPGKETYAKKAEELDKKFRDLWKELDEKGRKDKESGHGDVRGINFDVETIKDEDNERQESGDINGDTQGTGTGEEVKAEGENKGTESQAGGTNNADSGGNAEGAVSVLTKEAEDLLERRRQQELKDNSRHIFISSELFVDENGDHYKIQNLANGKKRISASDENGKTLSVLDEYEQQVPNDAIIAGGLTKVKDLNFTNKLKDEINAKYDAELAALEAKPTVTPSVSDKKADIERRRQEELNQQTDAGYSTIALDYLFTGGRDVILSTDYLLQALVGGFTYSAKEINDIRNKYADKLGNIKDDINSGVYNQMMNEIRDVINKNYNDSKATEIFDKILKNATGFTNREGNQTSIELDKLNEQNESKINAKYDAELKALEQQPTTSNQSEIEAKKADIERRRQGLNGVEEIIFSNPNFRLEGFEIDGNYWNVVTSTDRAKVLVNVNGVIVPFYLTTGQAGKGLIPGWYPFFGIGKDGWLNKTDKSDMETYYERYWGKETANIVKSISEELNSFYGTDPTNFKNDGDPNATSRPLTTLADKVEDYINSKLNYTPAINNGDARKTLRSNVEQLGKEINAKYDAELATLKQKRDGKATNEPSGVQREATTEDGAGQPGASAVDPAGTKQEAVQETVPSGNKMSVLGKNPKSVDIYVDKDGNEGTIEIDDGGKVEFRSGKVIRELGNIETDDVGLAAAGLTIVPKVKVLEQNKYQIGDKNYQNNLSNPIRAIDIDDDGNISVTLDVVQTGYGGVTPKTISQTFTGSQAEELAYQIHLQQISNNGKRFNEWVEREIFSLAQEGADNVNGQVSKGEDKQGEADKQAAKGEVRPEEQEVKRTLSGLTEEERLAAVEARKKETKFSDTEKGMQEFWSLVDRYEGLIEGARGKSSTSGQQLWGDILQKSKPLKIEVTRTKGGGVTKVVAKKGGKRLKNVKSYKEGNYKAISPNEDKALLDNRSGKVQDIFSKLYHNLESPGIQIEYGVKLSDVQKEQAFNDVADGIPSNGAEAVLNVVEKFVQDGNIIIYDESMGTRAVPIDEFFGNQDLLLEGIPQEGSVEQEQQPIQEDMEEPPFMINNGEVQNARKALDNATKRLREAEKRIAEANGVQMSAFNAPQGSLFGVKGEDIKAVIDPLKKAVKEAREAYDKAVAKAEAEENAKNGQQSLFQKEKRKLEPIDTVLFNKLLKNLNKAIPGVFGGVLEKKAFEEKLKEMHGISMRDKKGIIYGFVGHDGKVYLNGDVINANTPIHEYGHIFINIMKDKFPQVYRSGLNLADKSPYLSTLLSQGKKSDYAPLIERYKNGDKTALQEEALAMAIGDMGERMVQRNMKNAFLEWVDKMWTAIKRVFGGRLTDMTPEQLNRLTFKQFSNLVAGQLFAGDPVGLQGNSESNDIRLHIGKEWSIENKKHEVGNLSAKEIKELIKEIKGHFGKQGEVQWGKDNNDIRTDFFNTLAEKQVGSVVYSIGKGLRRDNKNTYLLYKNKAFNSDETQDVENIIGEYKSLSEAKEAIDNIKTIEIAPQFQIVGEKGAGQLDNAPNIVQAAKRLDNLEVAKNMESKGADARTIFLATGWQKGGDGKWKTEIGDITFNNLFEGDNPIAMQIEDNGFVKLGDLVSGEVLDAYPYLKDVPVKFVKGTPGNGQYDGKEIKLQYKSEIDFIINEQLLLKALAHEVQHFVQDQEGFAKGTTSDYFTEDKLNYMTQLVYEDFIFRNLEYDEYIKQHGNAAESVLEPLDEWEDFQKEAKKGKDNVIKILADAKRHSLSKYRKVAGEVEANNVMKRMDMPLSERLVKTFTDTEDVAEDEKIYLFDSKISNSTFDLNKYKAEKRRERAEDNVNRAKANLFNAWNNLKTVGVVSDPWQNSQNMKRVIDAAIELAIQVGAKTKEEIKAALNDVIKKHNLSPNQLNNIARAVKAYSEPFDQDIFNDLVQNTDSAHEAFGFLRLMRQNTKDPIKYGKVLKLEDELTKRQIEYEESQQVPEGTENNTKAEILKSFGEALTSYKMPLSQPKDVAITGAYNPLIDNEVFGTTMQASMLHATGFVKNWFDLFKARDISTKAFFQEVADYLAANPGSIYSEPIANASYRLLAELKRGYKNDKYWDSIYDIMNIPAQAQRRSNLGIALALGSQESSGHAFSGKLEAIEQFKAGLNENLTDEELDENNHGEIKRLGAEIHEEEGNRRPIPPPGYLQRKARRAYKEVEQSVINRVKEKIKGCK